MLDRTDLPRLTDRLRLGETGLRVSPVGLECAEDPATVAAAVEAGVNLMWICVDNHWSTSEGLRRGLRALLSARPALRDDLVIAAVSYVSQPAFFATPFQDLLDAVPELGRIDVLVAGGCFTVDLDGRLPRLHAHRDRRFAGARAIGAGLNAVTATSAVMSDAGLDLLCVAYNPAFPGLEAAARRPDPPAPAPLLYGHKSAFAAIASAARYEALGISEDHWRPDPGDSYRFALTPAHIDGLVLDLVAPHQLRELADALARGGLDRDEQAYLRKVTKLHIGAATQARGRAAAP